jgi:hypothetical protein
MSDDKPIPPCVHITEDSACGVRNFEDMADWCVAGSQLILLHQKHCDCVCVQGIFWTTDTIRTKNSLFCSHEVPCC